MDAKTAYVILSIVGSFCALGLAINAYFVKGMLESLNQVKLQTAVLIEKSKGVAENKEEIREIKEDIRKMIDKWHGINSQIHQIRGIQDLKKLREMSNK